jgi:hypothetical protein
MPEPPWRPSGHDSSPFHMSLRQLTIGSSFRRSWVHFRQLRESLGPDMPRRVRSLDQRRHDAGMQTREQRDEKTVVIATALGLFCLVIAVGGLSLWAAVSVLDLNDPTVSSLGWVIAAAAGVVLIVYLDRARRR